MRFWRFAVATAFCVAGAGCAAGDERAGLPPLGASFNCENPIDVLEELPDSYVTVADIVGFPGSGDMLQRGRTGPDNDLKSRRAFSKIGLMIRPGATFQIHVAPDSQRNALIDWGIEEDGLVGSIAVASCSGDAHDWLVYPGGVWTLEPACVELVILTATATETIRPPLGVSCS